MTSRPSRPARSSGSDPAVAAAPVPCVGVVIVSYKNRDDTLECLASLSGLTYPRARVYVVDQDSDDGTPDAARAAFPDVVVIENRHNNGFGGGSNIGIRRALEDGVDYLFLLNNDTTLAPDLLDRLVVSGEDWPELGIAGPLMLYADEPDVIWSAGGVIGPRGESIMLRQGMAAPVGGEEHGETDFIVGCGLLVKRAVLEQVGLFDESYFLYYEEADLCARARAAGWRVATLMDARLWHKVSRTTGAESELTLYYMRRNALRYLERHAAHPLIARTAAILDSCYLATVWTLRGRRSRAGLLMRAVFDYLRGKMGKADIAFRGQ